VQTVSVLAAEEQLRVHAVFYHVWRTPLAGYSNVIPEVPRKIVTELLRPALDLPSAERFEVVVIECKDSTGCVSIRCTESAQVDAIGTAMDSMWAAISSALVYGLRLNYFHNLWFCRIGFRVEHMDSGRAKARNDQIAALNMRMGRIRTKSRAACIPAEMVQLVSCIGHVDLPNDTRVFLRLVVNVDHDNSVRMRSAVCVQGCDIREFLRRSLAS